MSRPSQHPENPHPPGTFLAAHWDLGESMRRLGRSIRTAAEEDERLRRLARAGTSVADQLVRWRHR